MRTCKQQRSRHTVAGCRGVLRGSRVAIMRGSSAIIPAERAALRPRSFRRARGRPGVDSDLIRKHSAPSSLALLRSYPTVPLSRGPLSPLTHKKMSGFQYFLVCACNVAVVVIFAPLAWHSPCFRASGWMSPSFGRGGGWVGDLGGSTLQQLKRQWFSAASRPLDDHAQGSKFQAGSEDQGSNAASSAERREHD